MTFGRFGFGISRLGASGGRTSFSPASLFAGGYNGFLIRAADRSGRTFQDTAGTTPANIGDPVGLFLDSSGNINNLTQATAAARPTLATASGKPYFSFNSASSQYLGTPYANGGDLTIVAAVRETSSINGYIVGAQSSTVSGVGVNFSGGKPTGRVGTANIGDATIRSVDLILSMRVDNTGKVVEVRENGAVLGAQTYTGTTVMTIANALGAFNNNGTPSNFWPGRVYAALVIQRNLSAAQTAAVEANFAALCENPPTLAAVQQDLVLIGDSRLTASLGPATNLAALYPSRATSVQALSGQRSDEITGRFISGASMTLTGNTIPASGGVIVTASTPNLFWHQAAPCAIHGSIAGVPGTLSFDGTSTTTFTRDASGAAVAVSSSVQFNPDSGTAYNSATASAQPSLNTLYGDLAIIGLGYNDIYTSTIQGIYTYNQAATLARVASCVSILKGGAKKQFIVLGVFAGEQLLVNGAGGITVGQSTLGTSPSQAASQTALDRIAALNAALSSAYGSNYLDLQAAYVAAGYNEAATVNGSAYTLINNTLLPDGVHASGTTGKSLSATSIQNTAVALGYAP